MSGKTFSDEMTGIFGKNDYKQKDTHPDSRGRCKIKGVWYWISGWTRQAGSGNKFSSLAFTEMTMEEANKQEERSRARQAPQQPQQQPQQQAQQQQPQYQQQQPQQQQPQQQYQPEPQDFDDAIPF